jgi:copper chaperone
MKVKIDGMSCMHCVNAVKKALEGLDGITKIEVDLERGEASFENTKNLPLKEIKDAIGKAGYKVIE